jgi:rhodanese-related sulfurtransferase
MQLKNIFYILLLSSAVGLVFNHFNPKGITLFQKDKDRVWTDSLFNQNADKILINDSSSVDKQQKNVHKIQDTVANKINEKSLIESRPKEFEKPLAINLKNAHILYNNGLIFVDARNHEDYLKNHIKNSINIPFYQFEEYSTELKKIKKENPFVIYCNGKDCDMSDLLADALFEMGYRKIYLFVGGWEEWEAARYPSAMPYNSN